MHAVCFACFSFSRQPSPRLWAIFYSQNCCFWRSWKRSAAWCTLWPNLGRRLANDLESLWDNEDKWINGHVDSDADGDVDDAMVVRMMWRRRKKRRKKCFGRLPQVVSAIAAGKHEYPSRIKQKGSWWLYIDFIGRRSFAKTRHHFIMSDGPADARPFSEVFRATWWARSRVHGGCSARIFTFSHTYTIAWFNEPKTLLLSSGLSSRILEASLMTECTDLASLLAFHGQRP